MPKQLPIPTFNWKSSDQIREWDIFEAKAKLWLAGEKVEKELQYTQIVLMLGDKGLSRWTKFKLTDKQMKQPVNVFKVFHDSLGKDISFWTARAKLYKNFCQHQDESIAELDIRLSALVDECKFPTDDIATFIKRDILINSINYYEVKNWASKQKETADGDGDDVITYTKVIDKCKEHEAQVRDYILMANDNSQLQTAYQQGTTTVDEKTFKKRHQKYGQKQRSRSHSGSRERFSRPPKQKSKCKWCGFEKHTTPDGKCPALKSTCGFCDITGHYESACISKRTAQKRETGPGRGRGRGRHYSRSPTRRPGNNSGGRPAVGTNTITIQQTEQMKADFPRLMFHNITTSTGDEVNSSENFVTKLDTARDGTTYVRTELDVQ